MSSAATMQQAKADTFAKTAQQTTQLTTQSQPISTNEFADLRRQATTQRQRQDAANDSRQSHQLKAFQQMAHHSVRVAQLRSMGAMKDVAALQRMADEEEVIQNSNASDNTAQLEIAAETPQQNNTGLPDNLKSGIESLSGMRMDHVKVHTNSDKPAQLNAHAYAQGSEIHVAPGQEQHLPHEAWHVVQQAQGRVKPTMQMKSGVAVNDDVGLEAEADVMGAKALSLGIAQRASRTYSESRSTVASIMMKAVDRKANFYSGSDAIQRHGLVLQAAFAGPPLVPNNPVAGNYPNHTFTPGGVTANANCGIHNRIVTAGEHQNSGSSQPGTPSNMTAYQYGFSRTGGLVRDPALSQASTRLHLINHRFEDSGNTQGVGSNIMLGSKRANNPTHLHQVENPVLNALSFSATRLNGAYETALGNAQRIADNDNGGMVTFWAYGMEPAVNILPAARQIPGWLYSNGAVGRLPPPSIAPKYKKTSSGSVLSNTPDGYFVETINTAFLKRHFWVDYSVQATYSGAPNYISLNIAHERAQNGGAVNPTDPLIENDIVDFETTWKDQAIPASFTCNANYYMASFIPGTPYHRASEAPETIPSDT
nr:DUF4157 domain-containing protein [uncultured Undibacterium sp.]